VYALFPISVDDREQTPSPSARVSELEALGVPARVERLSTGDYGWMVDQGGSDGLRFVTVERKSIPDFIASVRDGRINRFLDESGGISEQPDIWRFLLLEGNQFTFTDYGYSQFDQYSLDNALVSLQSLGITVVRSSSVATTARRLKALWEYTGRDDHTTFLRPVRADVTGIYLNPAKKEAVKTVMGLGRGWGEARARAALETLGSPKAIIEAILAHDHSAFKDVKGVGKGLVDSAAEFLETEL
jgi:ERCC4-type nuclease